MHSSAIDLFEFSFRLSEMKIYGIAINKKSLEEAIRVMKQQGVLSAQFCASPFGQSKAQACRSMVIYTMLSVWLIRFFFFNLYNVYVFT